MSKFEYRKPVAYLNSGESGDFLAISSASIVMEVNAPPHAAVTIPTLQDINQKGNKFTVLKRDFKTLAAYSKTTQTKFLSGSQESMQLTLRDDTQYITFDGLVASVSPNGQEGSLQVSLASPLTKLSALSFSPLIQAVDAGSINGVSTQNERRPDGDRLMESLFPDSTDKFDNYNIFEATRVLFENGIELFETAPTSEIPGAATEKSLVLGSLRAAYEEFLKTEDVFADARIARPGIDTAGDTNPVNWNGFLQELLPLWNSPSYFSALLTHVFPKFQLQLSSLAGTGVLENRIEPVQIPTAPFSFAPVPLQVPVENISWRPGTVHMLPLKQVLLLSKNLSTNGVSTQNSRSSSDIPYQQASVFPKAVTESVGRLERYPAPLFFELTDGADETAYVQKKIKPVNKSPVDSGGLQIAEIKCSKFSKAASQEQQRQYNKALADIAGTNRLTLEKWAQVIFYGAVLGQTSGGLVLPFTPALNVGRVYTVYADNIAIFSGRLMRCVHIYENGVAQTRADFDHILVDGVSLPL